MRCFLDDLHNARDDVSRLDDPNFVPDMDIQLADVVPVAEGGAGDGGSAYLHRIEGACRNNGARVSDAYVDAPQGGDCALCLEFHGDLTLRPIIRFSQGELLRDIVDLDDDPVDPVGQGGPFRVGLLEPPPDRLSIADKVGGCIEAHLFHDVGGLLFRAAQGFPLRVEYAEGINCEELALRPVLSPGDAHGTIAGVREPFRIDLLPILIEQDHLAPDEAVEGFAIGELANRRHALKADCVGGDVLALKAVPS